MQELKCPGCGAGLLIDEKNKDMAVCPYCGRRILLDDYRSFCRNDDEAEAKKAEAELRKVKLEEEKFVRQSNVRKMKIAGTVFLGIIGGICLLTEDYFVSILCGVAIYFIWREKEETGGGGAAKPAKLKIPFPPEEIEQMHYREAVMLLQDAGFTNVTCVPLNDLILGILDQPEMAEELKIRGHKVTSRWGRYSANEPIIISYHSFKLN